MGQAHKSNIQFYTSRQTQFGANPITILFKDKNIPPPSLGEKATAQTLQWIIQTHSILQILLLKSKETQATNPPKDTAETR